MVKKYIKYKLERSQGKEKHENLSREERTAYNKQT